MTSAGSCREVDRHLVAGDDHRHLARQGARIEPVVVEGRLGRVGAVGNGADRGARLGLGLVPDGVDRAAEGRDAVAVDQFGDAVAAHQAAADLRIDVAHHLDRKARVVLDHPDDFAHRLAARPQLDGAELDALLEDVGGELRQRADVAAADIDPVHHHDHEADQRRSRGA